MGGRVGSRAGPGRPARRAATACVWSWRATTAWTRTATGRPIARTATARASRARGEDVPRDGVRGELCGDGVDNDGGRHHRLRRRGLRGGGVRGRENLRGTACVEGTARTESTTMAMARRTAWTRTATRGRAARASARRAARALVTSGCAATRGQRPGRERDCADPDCVDVSCGVDLKCSGVTFACGEGNCGDGIDNDGDGQRGDRRERRLRGRAGLRGQPCDVDMVCRGGTASPRPRRSATTGPTTTVTTSRTARTRTATRRRAGQRDVRQRRVHAELNVVTRVFATFRLAYASDFAGNYVRRARGVRKSGGGLLSANGSAHRLPAGCCAISLRRTAPSCVQGR